MRSQLAIIHRDRLETESMDTSLNNPQWIKWQTCVRELFIGLPESDSIAADLPESATVYRGRDAYRFLLEVVCGLQSPVKGETEVHGQYRELLDQIDKNHSLYSMLQKVHLDARKIRATHLQGLGSQSYGSLARKKLRGYDSVVILGAGQLTREILPWLTKQNLPVSLFVRRPDKHQDLVAKYKTVKVYSLNDDVKIEAKALLLAAPMSSGLLSDWLASKNANLDLILDYRGESHFDPLTIDGNYYSLRDIFREIDNTKQKVDAEIERAKQLVASICESY
jgi:glutamyl-tRNA reductase